MPPELIKCANLLPFPKKRGSMEMKGGISENKGRYGAKYVVRFKGLFKRFNDYEDAENFLITLNYKEMEGTFDPRDYHKGRPLGFQNLSKKWLEYKEAEGIRCIRNPRNHMDWAVRYFGNRNIKAIGSAEIEDFFFHLARNTRLSGKSRFNIRTTLKTFWKWVCKREKKVEMPDFPEVKYELGWRKIVDKKTQAAILNEVKRISWNINPKIYIGCLWLSTYVNVRPIELLHVKEEDIDLANGLITVKHNKVPEQYKKIYLIPEDVELIGSFPRAFPHLYFFRHEIRKGVHLDKRGRFGKDYWYKWWRTACENLGVEGVPLYPGTRHSTVVELGDRFTPEEIMGDGSEHSTNKAFMRYFKIRADKKRAIAAHARSAHNLIPENEQEGKGKLLKLDR